jgi:anti-anti-sigma regulatory factor
MLRTMIAESAFQQTWTLQGRLCGPWAADLQRLWQERCNARAGRECVVNLEGVYCVDEAGEEVLRSMAGEGAHLVASRAYMKYILEGLLALEERKD